MNNSVFVIVVPLRTTIIHSTPREFFSTRIQASNRHIYAHNEFHVVVTTVSIMQLGWKIDYSSVGHEDGLDCSVYPRTQSIETSNGPGEAFQRL